eukprot:3712776-Rhodomonas_salina.1
MRKQHGCPASRDAHSSGQKASELPVIRGINRCARCAIEPAACSWQKQTATVWRWTGVYFPA